MIEVKSLDVENTAEEAYINLFHIFGWRLKSSQRIFSRNTRPLAAFSYDSFTYIYSETDEVDYTKLVFERNTDMPFYEHITELENEFYELMENRTGNRPVEPDPLMCFSEWKEKFKPSVLSGKRKFMVTLLLTLLVGFVVSLPLGGIINLIPIMLLLILPCYGLTMLIDIIMRKTASQNNFAGHSLQKEYDQYKQWYSEQLERIQYYDYVTERIPQIFQEIRYFT